MQIEYILAGCILLLGFFMPVICYRKGLKEGYEMAKGKLPEPIKSPVKAVQEVIKSSKEKKETDEFLEGLNNLINYDGNPQGGDE
jgi:hypothetical protein